MNALVREFNADQQTALQLLRAYLSVKARLINTDSVVKRNLEKDPRFAFMTEPTKEQLYNTHYENSIGEERTTAERIEFYRLQQEFNRGGVFSGHALFDLIGRGSEMARMMVAAFPSTLDEHWRMFPGRRRFSRISTEPVNDNVAFNKKFNRMMEVIMPIGFLFSLATFLVYPTREYVSAYIFLGCASVASLLILRFLEHLDDVKDPDPARLTFDTKKARDTFKGVYRSGRDVPSKARAIDWMQAEIMKLEQLAAEYEKPEAAPVPHGNAQFASVEAAARAAGGR